MNRELNEAMRGSELGLIASFGVSQWASAALKCVLKGGSPPPAQPELQLRIRGFIPSQSAESLEALLAQEEQPTKGGKPKK